MNKLSNEQKRLVQEHLHVIDWVLYKSIAVNETVQGMGREDLYQNRLFGPLRGGSILRRTCTVPDLCPNIREECAD